VVVCQGFIIKLSYGCHKDYLWARRTLSHWFHWVFRLSLWNQWLRHIDRFYSYKL